MKRKIAIIISTFSLICGMMNFTASCSASDNVTVNIDGETLSQSGKIINSSTMVAMRTTLEKLGMKVNWEGNKQTAYASKGKTLISIDISQGTISKNGENIELTDKPQLIDGSVYIPLRAVSEIIGADIQWDPSTKSVYVNTADDNDDESYKSNTGSIDLDSSSSLADGVEIENNSSSFISLLIFITTFLKSICSFFISS